MDRIVLLNSKDKIQNHALFLCYNLIHTTSIKKLLLYILKGCNISNIEVIYYV